MALPSPIKARVEAMWTEAEADYRRKLLAALPTGPDLRLLDVGCGDGSFTDRQREHIGVPPSHVAGLEIIDEWREQARARGFDVRSADLENVWPFERDAFDVVVANQVIEHVKRLDHFINELYRVLRPGGRAVVCTENLASWHNIAALVLGYVPFSLTNVSEHGPIGNPFALHSGEMWPVGATMQHIHVLTHVGLCDIFEQHRFVIRGKFGAGYYPLTGRLASRLAQARPRHAHFIGIVVER